MICFFINIILDIVFVSEMKKFFTLTLKKIFDIMAKSQNCQCIFAISAETKQYWQKYRRDQIKIISTGVDFERFSPSIKDRKNEEINILFVGRLIARKNVDKIILAFRNLISKKARQFIIDNYSWKEKTKEIQVEMVK